MNIKQQRAALAKLAPQATKATQVSDTSWRDATVNAIGATPVAVTSFFGDIATSYKFHKAVREGQIK